MRDPTSEVGAIVSGIDPISQGALTFLLFDALEGANWQRTGKKSGRPDRLLARLQRAKLQESATDRAMLTDEQLLELAMADPALAALPAAGGDEEDQE